MELICQLLKVQVRISRCASGDGSLPQLKPLDGRWHGEFDDRAKASEEGLVDVLLEVGRQDCTALKDLQPL